MNLLNWLFVHQPSVVGNVSNLTVFALLGTFARAYLKIKCKSCMRIALHKVTGTVYRTCVKHTTVDHHDMLRVKHAEEHPEQHELLNEGKDTCTSVASSGSSC